MNLYAGLPTENFSGDNAISLAPRQAGLGLFCPWVKFTRKRKLYHFQQVSDTNLCRDGECAASVSTEHSFGIEGSINIGADLGGLVKGVSANIGATVTKTWTNGKTNECNAKENESVCVWVKVPYYEVELERIRAGGGVACTNPFQTLARFPESKDANANYQCERHTCEFDGANNWRDEANNLVIF